MPICSPRQICKVIPTPLYKYDPTQTPTHLHTIMWPAHTHRLIHIHSAHEQVHTQSCMFSVAHIYPCSGLDASGPHVGVSPFCTKCFFRKVYSVPQNATPPCPHRGGLLGLSVSPPSTPPLALTTVLQQLTPQAVVHHISTFRNQQWTQLSFQPKLYVGNSLGPVPNSSGCYMATPEALWSQKLQPCHQALPATKPNSCQVSPQQGDAYITRVSNAAGYKPDLC